VTSPQHNETLTSSTHRAIQMLHHMEAVEDDLGVRQVLADGRQLDRPHVAADHH